MERRDSSSDETVSGKIIAEVASTKNVDPLALEPLYGAIDPDAVSALVERGFDGRIEFQYAGCTVNVDGEGRIQVEQNRRSSERFRVTSELDSES